MLYQIMNRKVEGRINGTGKEKEEKASSIREFSMNEKSKKIESSSSLPLLHPVIMN